MGDWAPPKFLRLFSVLIGIGGGGLDRVIGW